MVNQREEEEVILCFRLELLLKKIPNLGDILNGRLH